MELSYRKQNNKVLFNTFSDPDILNMEKCQNYIPLYNEYFNLNSTNYDSINLNNKYNLQTLNTKISENIYNASYIKSDDAECSLLTNQIFLKLSPLIDPYKYLLGKLDISDTTLLNLPKLENKECHKRMLDTNNTSYVDSFFSFLSCRLLNNMKFIHGIDYYGSYLGIKNNYVVNIAEDIDTLTDSDFFYNNNNKIYNFLNSEYENAMHQDSRKHKKKLIIDTEETLDIDFEMLNIESLEDNTDANTTAVFEDLSLNSQAEFNISEDSKIAYKKNRFIISCSNSNCSSRSSNTVSSDTEDGSELESSSESASTSESESSYNSEDDNILVSINKFPIQIIAMEKCENTFDYLLDKTTITNDELSCIIIQILMILITYQKIYDFTHNDLHTNNIMFINTEKVYLYYKIDNKHYKIKTYGKIFKIIDFGRAIYRYKDKQICSDSFASDGDAATQYNFHPYYNADKPILEPNPSFDLCRLGCSIYDFIADLYDEDDSHMASIHKIIVNWCNDDDGNNILYKSSGEERYPDFKLYKMIARKVHKHTPYKELQHKHFNKYIVSKKDIKKGSNIWNIDILEPDFKTLEHQQMPVVQPAV